MSDNRSPFVVAHRGASAALPEHTLAAYELALTQGAHGLECDVRLTRDGVLVCVHDRSVERTSDGTGIISELTLAELKQFNFGTPDKPAEVLTLSELLTLTLDFKAHPAKVFIETKHPVRYGGLVETKLLAELQRFGLASPASADLSRAVVMSFAATAVWRIRRAAPMLPTVLLGESALYLTGGTAHTVGATAIGPAVQTLRDHPDLVDKAAAAGRATYCWTVDDRADVEFCAQLGVSWIATNHPARTKAWVEQPEPGV